jgi:hypothetical protein
MNTTLFWQIAAAVFAALWLRAEARCVIERLQRRWRSRRAARPAPAPRQEVSIPIQSPRNNDQSDFMAAMKGMGIERREAMRRWAATSGPLEARLREALKMGGQLLSA